MSNVAKRCERFACYGQHKASPFQGLLSANMLALADASLLLVFQNASEGGAPQQERRQQ